MSKKPIADPVQQLRAEAEAKKRLAEEAAKDAALALEAAEKLQWLKDRGYDVTLTAPESEPSPEPVTVQEPVAFGRPTWTTVVRHILKGAEHGFTNDELERKVRAHPLLPRLPKNFRNFYGAMERLKVKKELVRYQGRVYATQVFEDLKRRGELPTDKAQRPQSRPTRVFVMRALEEAPQGLTADEICDRVMAMPDAPRRIRAKAVVVTVTIDDLTRRGILVADGAIYRLKKGVKWIRGKNKKAKGTTSAKRHALQDATLFGSDAAPPRHH